MQYYSLLKEMSYQAIKIYEGNLNAYCMCIISCVWLFCDFMDYSLPGSSICAIFQARILEWVIISFCRGSSWPRDWAWISCIGRQILYYCATWEAPKETYPWWFSSKESTWNAGDLGLIPGLGRSPGGGHGNPLLYSCLENPHGQRRLAGYSP